MVVLIKIYRMVGFVGFLEKKGKTYIFCSKYS
jgi:hypothetical protein